MKHRKIKIFIMIVILIIVLILIPIIKKKIMINTVKDKFLSTMYEINRNGNYHVVFKDKFIDVDNDYNTNCISEAYSKDGKSIHFNYTDETKSKTIVAEEGDDIYYIMENDDGQVSGLYRTKQWFNMIETNNAIGAPLIGVYYADFKSVEKGKYNDKNCYIIEAEDTEVMKYTIYIDTETYLPYRLEYIDIDSNTREEIEWITIELGNVTKIPEYDLVTIREYAVPASQVNQQ